MGLTTGICVFDCCLFVVMFVLICVFLLALFGVLFVIGFADLVCMVVF